MFDYKYIADCGNYGTVEAPSMMECIARIRVATANKKLHYMNRFSKENGADVMPVWKYNSKFIYDMVHNPPIAKVTRALDDTHVGCHKTECKTCGTSVPTITINHGSCTECYKKICREESIKEYNRYSTAVNGLTVIGCTTGVCREVRKHHEQFIDDPERLTSEFILGLMCGEHVRKAYVEHKQEKVSENVSYGMRMIFGDYI